MRAAISASTLILATPSAILTTSVGRAQDTVMIGDTAKEITVKIESATQGTGVIVEKSGEVYVVLTAWHVVKSHRKDEELEIVTSDGRIHKHIKGSIQRLGNLDLAKVEFKSQKRYEPAKIADSSSVRTGSRVFVSGFPLPTTAVPKRVFRFLDGMVIANASVDIPNGYSLLYNNKTLPGMSGGSVLNRHGQLIGIHGQGETDYELSQGAEIAVKTGTNQGIPSRLFQGRISIGSNSTEKNLDSRSPTTGYPAESLLKEVRILEDQAKTADDHLAIANRIKDVHFRQWPVMGEAERDRAQEADSDWNKLVDSLIKNARLSSALSESSNAYMLEATGYIAKVLYKKFNREDYTTIEGAKRMMRELDYREKAELAAKKSLAINPKNVNAMLIIAAGEHGYAKLRLLGEILDIDPENDYALASRGAALFSTARLQEMEYSKKPSSWTLRIAIGMYRNSVKDYEKLDSLGLMKKHKAEESYPLSLWRLAMLKKEHARMCESWPEYPCNYSDNWEQIHRLQAKACTFREWREVVKDRCRQYGGR